ncbi:tyrosine-protein phosphatase [Paraclostridium sordellii]|uniref:tyrosine-protein phosphatase n=1 Tax=Paraclostridium sordellii TaxID=1505 RepID=UPI0005DE1482|nr:tyrosine-protein phosphatase [Paeniclostridium sordellii]CEQ17962.1 protein-tyrosine phosphatase [[Clostridium] sordellii] [Paeniclostridium sordellii]
MENLKGEIIRENEDDIVIHLNHICKSGKIFYKDNLDSKDICLMDFINTDIIKFKDPKPENRTFYKVVSGDEEITLAERIVPLKNFSNFRDLGGYETKDGRNVKWGLFYRSEDLSNLKGEDLKYFESLGIKYVLDYRSSDEVLKNPDVEVKSVKNINISGMNLGGNDNLDMTTYVEGILSGNKIDINPEELLKQAYKNMPLDNPAYKELFKLFKNPKNTAILQHCTAGKDRTGVGAALILLALNVDEETVIKDYLESNDNREGLNKKIMEACKDYIKDEKTKQMIEGILGVKESFIKASLNSIKEKYRTYEEYFEAEYDLGKEELNKLRDTYLN